MWFVSLCLSSFSFGVCVCADSLSDSSADSSSRIEPLLNPSDTSSDFAYFEGFKQGARFVLKDRKDVPRRQVSRNGFGAGFFSRMSPTERRAYSPTQAEIEFMRVGLLSVEELAALCCCADDGILDVASSERSDDFLAHVLDEPYGSDWSLAEKNDMFRKHGIIVGDAGAVVVRPSSDCERMNCFFFSVFFF